MQHDEMRFIFQHSTPYSPHTFSIDVAVLGFHWSNNLSTTDEPFIQPSYAILLSLLTVVCIWSLLTDRSVLVVKDNQVLKGRIKYHFFESLVRLDQGLNPGLRTIGEHTTYWYETGHWHDGWIVRQWPGKPRFNSWSSHTKGSKNGTWCLLA